MDGWDTSNQQALSTTHSKVSRCLDFSVTCRFQRAVAREGPLGTKGLVYEWLAGTVDYLAAGGGGGGMVELCSSRSRSRSRGSSGVKSSGSLLL